MSNQNRNRIRNPDRNIIGAIEGEIKKYAVMWKEDKPSFYRALAPYMSAAYLGDIFAKTMHSAPGGESFTNGIDAIQKMLNLNANYVPSLAVRDLTYGIAVALFLRLLVYARSLDEKKFRKGEEYGSAAFGGETDILPFMDRDNFYNNVILSATERISLNPRMPDPAHNRNKNVLIVGGSGSGKTRGIVKPALMQLATSYVVTDPKGTVAPETGMLLKRAGYKILILNTINFKKSMHYNRATCSPLKRRRTALY